MSSVSEMRRGDKEALGPTTPAQLDEYLSDIWAGGAPAAFPIQAVIKAVWIVKALTTLEADGISFLIRDCGILITWPLCDVVIEIFISDRGDVSFIGKANTPDSPVVRISTVIAGINGAVDVAHYQNMMKELA